MVVLPFALLAGGLTLTSATDVVIFAVACMALNILVGHTGLVSFGHGAWFGVGAYAAALTQKYWFPGSVLWPVLASVVFLLVAAVPIGFLVLRRRGVYFSLLTLAFSALTYAIAYRWTAFTGGESGLGGVTRANWLGFDLEKPWIYYTLVAVFGLTVVYALERFHRSAIGTVLVAIRENEQRAQFIGYATNRYKQIAYAVSAVLTGCAGVLFAFHHRFASADPTSVSFSGALLAMVIIGGMRSLLGPALGALFYILFQEYLSIWTANWLLYFGLLFVGFIVFSPTGLVGVWRRLTEPFKPKVIEAAAMDARSIEQGVALPEFLKHAPHADGVVLEARDLAKSFGGIKAVTDASLAVRRSIAARADRTQRRRQDDSLQSHHRHVRARSRFGASRRRSIAGLPPYRIAAAGLGRSFQITNLFPGVSIAENLRLAVQARDASHFNGWADAQRNERVTARTAELIRFLGLSGIEQAEAGSLSYGGQRLLDMGLAFAGAPRVLLLDEPLAGLAARERERVAGLIKRISSDLPVLLVEHDIDRVFALADRVTVMNEGNVLVDGTASDARESQAVREVYIGSGTAALAAKPRGQAERAGGPLILDLDKVDAFYGKSHIVMEASLKVHEHEIVALLGRNGAGKSTLLKTIIGIVTAQGGRICSRATISRGVPRRPMRAAASAMCRRGVASLPE